MIVAYFLGHPVYDNNILFTKYQSSIKHICKLLVFLASYV